ncbi:hypothetical protein BRADI_4g08305v3, partial [Brachypodium distachyon]
LLSIEYLSLSNNRLSGEIPSALGNLSGLWHLDLGGNMLYNNLSGLIPASIWNISSLTAFSVQQNMLSGTIPPDAFNNLPRLHFNLFSGVVPPELGSLRNLNWLQLSNNLLQAKGPKDWEFLSALANCSQLQTLDLCTNKFGGVLPDSFSNLQSFFAFSNKISGSIPLTIGNLTELNYFDLDANAFSGSIPSTLGNMTNLLALGLSSNKFTGQLSDNNLEGSLPQELGNLKNLLEFHAYSNNLSGEIPSTLGECQLLRNLYLQNNILTGRMPSFLSQLKGLENLDLSTNNLSGEIPKFLGNISMLYYLNRSFNAFVGEVPNFGVFAGATAISIQGNNKLCGGIPDLHLPPCSSQVAKKRSLLIPTVVPLVATVVIFSLICIFLSRCGRTTKLPSTTSMQGHPFISYPQLVRATDSFSTANMLGSGAFGTVFKGNIGAQAGESTSVVAVEILTACSSIDSRGNDFKAIVFDFMPNGTLEGWLHPDTNDQPDKHLNLLERVTILLDVANALDYLHCPVLHCDLKTSNVLLDAELVGHVGDFGLAKILVETSSYFQQPKRAQWDLEGQWVTHPQVSPLCSYATEYGAGNVVSAYGDIYSSGILVLETVTAKRPTDSEFIGGLNIRQNVELGLGGSVMDVIDNQLSLNLENELQTVDDYSYKLKTDCLISQTWLVLLSGNAIE